jgi:nucleotide-binding universal stress UspA family protein
MKHYMAAHPTGLIAVASHLRTGLAHVAVGSAAANIVHGSTAPALAVPVR